MMTMMNTVGMLESLPALPTVAIDVLRLMKSDDVAMDELADVIQNDPAVTAKLLKMVNSSVFGTTCEVASVQRAMVLLGLRSVKIMVLSVALGGRLQGPGGRGFRLRRVLAPLPDLCGGPHASSPPGSLPAMPKRPSWPDFSRTWG